MKYNKPDFSAIWADGGAIIVPSKAKIQSGWAPEIPPHQWENFIQNRQDQHGAYYMQQGIPEWSDDIEYQAGTSFIQYNGSIYKALTTQAGIEPSDSTNWLLVLSAGSSTSDNVISFNKTSRTLTIGDSGRYLRATSNSPVIITIPTTISVNIPIGTEIQVERAGNGSVSIANASGVTSNIRAAKTRTIAERYGVVSLKKVDTNTWTLFGDFTEL